ncbi:sensor domain-containing diguanylate cyclase [Amphritea sp. 1_MG-2023]|uniref:sensor domain-containing diguanylate cyclase n=1 Tax=Amphritea sp. 1_MG-2023 TaxID=3062670 RepID=UPI0026E240BB|nr:sensor domain-containing diguanylate cyclase [Amphritea sp. 1_MG-2023]MDO6563385.1 sensor domain-containing diguanylate cyclase [Amphritea sp. 1_MG-2023]
MSLTHLRKPSFILISGLLLTIAFSAISLISYYVANRTLNQHISTNTLPLTSDTIYSEVQRDLLQPILVSSLMAQDTFVHDWIAAGELNSDQIQRYLYSIQQRYNAFTAFFVSDFSRNYYHSSGVLKQVTETDSADQWYFDSRQSPNEFDINLDFDTAAPSTTTLFVNHKVKDEHGKLLGVIGVGLASQTIKELIEMYQNRYGRQIYFIDPQGKVTMQGSQYQGANDIHTVTGLKELAPSILSSPGGSYHYDNDQQTYLIKTRYIPELSWYLIVQHTEQSEAQITTTLWINLSFSFVVILLVLLLQHYTLGGYQRRLEHMANTDPLTGASSRHAFELVFQQILNYAKRQKHPVSTILVDIDYFKSCNDRYGHLLGDTILTRVADVLTRNLRQADTLCRWGGDEFFIVLPNCHQEDARLIAEKMRQEIETSLHIVDGKTLNVTASFGIAEYTTDETTASLFNRSDLALYRAKSKARNQVEVTTNTPINDA